MRSIGDKILKSTLFWIFILVALMTAVSIAVVNSISANDSEIFITQACEKETLRFNNEFSTLENSVTMIYMYVKDLEAGCPSEDELLTDDFCGKIQEMTLNIANRTNGAMAVYFRYDPELAGSGTRGFFWSRDNDDEAFTYFEPTDILQYDKDDTEHVGWFYEPKEKERAIWMSPYLNKNLNVYMISYVIPYFTKSGNFLGVIGMDINFQKVLELTRKVNLYKTSRTFLADLSTRYMDCMDENGKILRENLSITIYNHITTIDKDSPILTITDDGGKQFLTCVGYLRNGMRLILYVSSGEIHALRNSMLLVFAFITAAALAAAVFCLAGFTQKIVNPLKKLTEITGKYAGGDWEETFVSDTGDEIQELSESISVMAETTRNYIERIHENAMRDALTGLKNKNCYLAYVKKFSDAGQKENHEYTVAVFDINFLKKVNDSFGHEAGDQMIRMAGQYICDVFGHSPVFRIGGDEFCAILEGKDYPVRTELCKQFMRGLLNSPPAAGDVPLSISYGTADFPKDGKDYDEVFQAADERMYELKKKMKAERK